MDHRLHVEIREWIGRAVVRNMRSLTDRIPIEGCGADILVGHVDEPTLAEIREELFRVSPAGRSRGAGTVVRQQVDGVRDVVRDDGASLIGQVSRETDLGPPARAAARSDGRVRVDVVGACAGFGSGPELAILDRGALRGAGVGGRGADRERAAGRGSLSLCRGGSESEDANGYQKPVARG